MQEKSPLVVGVTVFEATEIKLTSAADYTAVGGMTVEVKRFLNMMLNSKPQLRR